MIGAVYLAGPDVFLPDARDVGRRKVELCSRYGFRGVFPLDNEIEDADSPEATGLAIYRANVALMMSADAIIANLTPFRGPSADVGTAFELGFFAAIGRPIFAYSSDPTGFAARTRAMLALPPDATTDADARTIEPFGLLDNLMLPGAVAAGGGQWITRAEPRGADPLPAFAAFEAALALLAAALCDDVQRAVG